MAFEHLNHFFTVCKDIMPAAQLEDTLRLTTKHIESFKESGDINSLKGVYETAVTLIENEAVKSGFENSLLQLQRNLYRELEQLIAVAGHDKRHHFLIVIPVADRPLMLKNCLASLKEQCNIFRYGGMTDVPGDNAVYSKVSVFIVDDSSEESHRRKIRTFTSDFNSDGIRAHYIGLDEQSQLLSRLPQALRQRCSGIIGRYNNPVPPHKGASITRNIAFLYMHFISAGYEDNALIYFIDSDEEFRIKARAKNGIKDISFINYFYWLDRIFETTDAEVLTGKVVGDPPVSPAVMINTFLDDLCMFFDSVSRFNMSDRCVFHEGLLSGGFSAEYHDMAKLFGYRDSSPSKKYACRLSGVHTIRDCFEDLANRAGGFFYGLHPTRTQFYNHTGSFLETVNARTVYTGNYVFSTNGLKHFIPFADLKLRMAGPALGRILKMQLKERFVSANMPLLHRRTIPENPGDEYRAGIFKKNNAVDLSEEFIKQFWGDVMLFSVIDLTEAGYPDQRIDFQKISDTVHAVQDKLWKLYQEQQHKTDNKISSINNYISHTGRLQSSMHEIKEAVDKFSLFCEESERNFGMNSNSMEKLSVQIDEGAYTQKIINSVHCFYEDEKNWNHLLGTGINTAPGG